MSYFGFSGYINPFTQEGHLNELVPKSRQIFVAFHEQAHLNGFAAENEANFIGFMAARNSKNQYFEYISYSFALRYALYYLRSMDKESYSDLKSKVRKGVLEEWEINRRFWNRYENPIEPFIKWGYDLFLKSNNQTEGIRTYGYVINLIIQDYLREIQPTEN